MEAAESNSTKRHLEKLIDSPLSEKTTADYEKALAGFNVALEGTRPKCKTQLPAKEQQKLAVLETAAKHGFAVQSTLANKFRAEKGQDPEYKKLNRDGQAEFRRQWAAEELNLFKAKKVHTQEWSRVDRKKGEYLSISQLVVDQGGWTDPGAIQAAIELATQCVAMGGDWIMMNPQTKRAMFFRLKFEWEEDWGGTVRVNACARFP